ncbi:hypothetical protein FRC01_003573, partial [Tulasnella sp. 417]
MEGHPKPPRATLPPPSPTPPPISQQDSFITPSTPEVIHDIPAAGPNTIEYLQQRSVDLEHAPIEHETGANNAPRPPASNSTPKKAPVNSLPLAATKNGQQAITTFSPSHLYQGSRDQDGKAP